MGKKALEIAVGCAVLFYFAYAIAVLATQSDLYQWDCKVYTRAAKVFTEGLNPYDPKDITTIPRSMPCSYPPLALFAYRLCTNFDEKTACHIQLLLKCIALIVLLYIWKKDILKGAADIFFYPFCLFAFNGAVFLDLRSGNINLFEQLLLWIAFSQFVRKRYAAFAAFVLAASVFKLTPVFFLVLLCYTDHPRKRVYFFTSLALFVGYIAIQYILMNRLFIGFIHNALSIVHERGILSPSLYALVRDLATFVSQRTGVLFPGPIVLALYGLIALLVLAVSNQALVMVRSAKTIPEKEKMVIFLAVLTFCLVHPRFKDYMYILIIPPAYYIIKTSRVIGAYPLLFLLIILSSRNVTLPGMSNVYSFLWDYYPLWIACGVWALFLSEIMRQARGAIEGRS